MTSSSSVDVLDPSPSSTVVAVGGMIVDLAGPVSPDGLFGEIPLLERGELDFVAL